MNARPPPSLCMIVEDQRLVAMDSESMFSAAGFSVSGPFDDWTLALAEARLQLPDVAVVGYHARDGACDELLRFLQLSNVPFVIYSGCSPSAAPEFAGETWVGKPCVPEDLLQAVLGRLTPALRQPAAPEIAEAQSSC